MTTETRLTQLSSSSGCGCKIAPAVLHQIMEQAGGWEMPSAALLVGNDSLDDAAVYQISDSQAIVSTVDFFTPIVDDPYEFGRIAAANALSDVYAMGATPLFAMALLSWPVDVLGTESAAKVMQGAKAICAEAGIRIAGGHSIAGKEPIFGLSVNGMVHPSRVMRNTGALPGDLLCLTKPIGTGILATAIKRNLIKDSDYDAMLANCTRLNRLGASLDSIEGIHALTDVTGFGLLGHSIEMCGNSVSLGINLSSIPRLPNLPDYTSQFVFPDNTWKNWNACEPKTGGVSGTEMVLLCDPQTSGGLLIAVAEESLPALQQLAATTGDTCTVIGQFSTPTEKTVWINP